MGKICEWVAAKCQNNALLRISWEAWMHGSRESTRATTPTMRQQVPEVLLNVPSPAWARAPLPGAPAKRRPERFAARPRPFFPLRPYIIILCILLLQPRPWRLTHPPGAGCAGTGPFVKMGRRATAEQSAA